MNTDHAWRIFDSAELVCSAETVAKAIDELANNLRADYRKRYPLVLTVMKGGMVFAGWLLPRLDFPLSCDYIHATRYRNTTRGDSLEWLAMPAESVTGRHVLLLDDILDEGHTLAAIKTRLLELGAAHVACAVLTDKRTGVEKPIQAEYVGIEVPNRYIFGCGMDIEGAWRNLPAIYALPELPPL